MGTIYLNAVYINKNCIWCGATVAAREQDIPACWDCQELYEKIEGSRDLVAKMLQEIDSKTKEDN